jgi:HupE / UreJ protein
MKKLLWIAACSLPLLPASAFAHRLDEYLEATILSVESGRIDGSMRLVPGVAVSSIVVSGIDTNRDGVVSEAEQMTYANRVLQNLSLGIDGRSLPVHLVSVSFPTIDKMKQGAGEIQISFTASLPVGSGRRRLIFENHDSSGIAVYLVNCLVPQDKDIQIATQNRNENQSHYQLDFVQGGAVGEQRFLPSFSGFAGSFHLGLRHIAEGTDHLLFLLALLLPAPLLAKGGRWSQRASVQRSLLQILRIVTAFTLGHSLTLALAAFGVVQLPSRPVEVLIAVSILISAIHAIRPLFPGREDVIAAFFGLVHGLAFASALGDLGFSSWYRLVSLFGFNLGIEAMQLTVVAITLPSLLLLSRTRAYALLRTVGACFAALAALGWIVERLLNIGSVTDPLVESVAHRAPWIAMALFLLSLCCWPLRELAKEPAASA